MPKEGPEARLKEVEITPCRQYHLFPGQSDLLDTHGLLEISNPATFLVQAFEILVMEVEGSDLYKAIIRRSMNLGLSEILDESLQIGRLVKSEVAITIKEGAIMIEEEATSTDPQ